MASAMILLNACTTADHRAEYSDGAATITVELISSHPVLAEYDRILVLSLKGKEIARQKLLPDTGGYASSNLYRCSPQRFMLKGYFDVWLVDVGKGTLTEGQCSEGKNVYIGVFSGGGSKPWRFYSAVERKEERLEPQGE